MCPLAEHRDRDRQRQDLSVDAMSTGRDEAELEPVADALSVRPITDRGPTPFSPRTLNRWGARFPAAKLCVVRSSGSAESVL